MAARIDIKEPGLPKYSVTWNLGQKFSFNPNYIVSAQIDGDEQFLIPYPNKIQVLTGTEAILYGCYIKSQTKL